MPVRVRDIPADHAQGLRRIHEFAAESARLHHLQNTAGASVTERLGRQQQIDQADRERGLLEITVRGNGVPTEWVDLARRLGFSRQPWTPAQILPPPSPSTRARANRNRVASDLHLLADMAAVCAVRQHLLTHHQISIDPNSVAEHQFRRNMQTLWQRAVVTAAAIGMPTSQRERITDTAATDLDQRLSIYRDLTLDDLDTLWHAYTGATFGDTARRKLTKTPDRDTTAHPTLPAPQDWLEQARTRLSGTAPANPTSEIADAVAAAVTDHDLSAARELDHHPDHLNGASPDHHAQTGPDP